MLEVTNSWSVNIDNVMFNGVILTELKKAFDTIDHHILLLKLSACGIVGNLFRGDWVLLRELQPEVQGQRSKTTSEFLKVIYSVRCFFW